MLDARGDTGSGDVVPYSKGEHDSRRETVQRVPRLASVTSVKLLGTVLAPVLGGRRDQRHPSHARLSPQFESQ